MVSKITVTVLCNLLWTASLFAQSPPAGVIPADYFGMHIGDALVWPTHDTLNRTVDVNYLGKGTRVGWGYIQCSLGAPGSAAPAANWSRLDGLVAQAAAHGIKYLATFDGAPCWAAPLGSTCHNSFGCSFYTGKPNNESDWINFVTAHVQRYQSRNPNTVEYELWGEPENGFIGFPGTPSAVTDFVTMTNDAYAVIRANAPLVRITSPSFLSSTGINAYYAAGGTKNIDVVAHHFEPGTCLSSGNAEQMYGSFYYSAIQAAYNSNGLSAKTRWDTESNWGSATGCPDTMNQAQFTLRDFLLQWSTGVSQVHWYQWRDAPGVWGSMFDGTTIFPDSTAYVTARAWMIGATMTSACTHAGIVPPSYQAAIITCPLTRPGGYQALAVWNTAGNSNYTVPSPYTQYRDWQNGSHSSPIGSVVTIGLMPILLETSSISPPTGLTIVVH